MPTHTTVTCPVHPQATVLVDLGDGCPLIDRADSFSWGPGAGPNGEGRILAFTVIDTRSVGS